MSRTIVNGYTIEANADLRGADLRGCIGNGTHIKTYLGLEYGVVYTHNTLFIGCVSRPIEYFQQWREHREEIAGMAGDAIEFAEKHMDFILSIVAHSPAEQQEVKNV